MAKKKRKTTKSGVLITKGGQVTTINKNIRATGGMVIGNKKNRKIRMKKKWTQWQKVY